MSAGSTVPDDETVWVMVPVATVWTVVVVVISGAALELRVPSQVPTPAATTTTARAAMIVPFLVYHFLRLGATCASLIYCRTRSLGVRPGRHALRARQGPAHVIQSGEHLCQATTTCEIPENDRAAPRHGETAWPGSQFSRRDHCPRPPAPDRRLSP